MTILCIGKMRPSMMDVLMHKQDEVYIVEMQMHRRDKAFHDRGIDS